LKSFSFQNKELHAESVLVTDLMEEYGSPLYIYSKNQIEFNWKKLENSFGAQSHLICYAVKANSNLAVLNILAKLSSRLRLSDEKITDVSLFGTEQRVCLELVRMTKLDTKTKNIYQIKQMPTQANFANIIGSSRETVSRILAKLRDDQIIIKTESGFIVPDKKQLEKRAFL